MARTGLFALLHYRVHVRPHLYLASRENAVLARMARDVPASVYRHWQATAHVEFPGIRTTRANYAVACSALLQFFHLVAIENAPMMLPSKAADSVWHTWLAHDAAGLSAFLIKHLKRDVPHVEKAGMGNAQRSMADTWRAAHDYHGNGQFSGPLPSIFEADKITRMPHGFWYDRNPRDRREGHYHDMDANGAPDLRIKGERVLCWSHVYEVMTPARRARADAELVRHYQTPVHVSARHAKRLESLGVPLGTTASVFLAKEALAMAAHEGKHSGRERRDDQDSMLGCWGAGPSTERPLLTPTYCQELSMRPSLLLVFAQLMVGALLVTSDSFPESTGSVAMLMAARIVSEGASSSDYRSSADSSCGSGGGGSTTNGGGD